MVICCYFGIHLLSGSDGFNWGRDFEAAQTIIQRAGLRFDLGDMFESHIVFDLPPIAGFPAIKHFTGTEIHHFCAVMRRIEAEGGNATTDSEDFDGVQDMLRNLKDSFDICQRQGLDMITFSH